MDTLLHIFPYIVVQRDNMLVRILATDPIGTMTFREYLEFQSALDGVAELAIVKDGQTICYL